MILCLKFEDFEAMDIARDVVFEEGLSFEIDSTELCESTGESYYSIVIDIESAEDYDASFEALVQLECLRESEEPNAMLEAKGNPFHDKSGKFTNPAGLSNGGSYSLKKGRKRKQHITKSKPKKGGGHTIMYGRPYNTGWGSKDPCGRDARKNGGDVRCSKGESFKKMSKKGSKKLKRLVKKMRK